MKEKLSAMVDGELEDDGLQGHLSRLRSDPDLRTAWDTYHLIGDALRGHVTPEIATRVISRLREEPTVLAPQRSRTAAKRIGWYGMYAAATMAAVAVVTWTAFPGWHADSQIAENAAAVSTASVPEENVVVTLPASEVENYLLAHQPYSHAGAMQGIAPYVRSVSEERRAAGK